MCLKNDKMNVLTIIFNSIICKKRLQSETLVIHINDNNYNITSFSNLFNTIKNNKSNDVIFINLLITDGSGRHQNLLILDMTSRECCNVYKIDPQNQVSNTVDKILNKRIQKINGFCYKGDIVNYVYCPKLLML